jgi:hypothetical protein
VLAALALGLALGELLRGRCGAILQIEKHV